MKTLLILLLVILTTATAIQAQWIDHPDPLFANASLHSVQVLDNNNVWAINYDSNVVVKTTDGGLTWTALPVTDPTFADYYLESIAVIDPNTAWLTAITQPSTVHYSRTYKTINGGVTWQLQNTFTNNWTTANHFFDANNGLNLGLMQFSNSTGTYTAPVITITSDGGTTWTPVSVTNLPAGSQPVYNRAFSVINNTMWYIGSDAMIYKSIDKGQTWTATNPGFPTTPFNAPKSIAFINANNGLAASYGVLKRTTDGGATWVTVNPIGTWKSDEIAAVPGKASTYISAGRYNGNAGSYVSFDNGSTWQVIESTNKHFDIHFKNPSTGWSGGLGTMYKFGSNILGTPKETATANSFSVYPNPGKGTYLIKSATTQPFSLEVFDVLGKKVMQLEGKGLGINVLDLSGQKKGIYLLHILGGEQKIIEKIVLH